jgi:hypothetical protein
LPVRFKLNHQAMLFISKRIDRIGQT